MKRVNTPIETKHTRAKGAGRKLNTLGQTPSNLCAGFAPEIVAVCGVAQKKAIILAADAIAAVFANGKMSDTSGVKSQDKIRQAIKGRNDRAKLLDTNPQKTDPRVFFSPVIKNRLWLHVLNALEEEAKKKLP